MKEKIGLMATLLFIAAALSVSAAPRLLSTTLVTVSSGNGKTESIGETEFKQNLAMIERKQGKLPAADRQKLLDEMVNAIVVTQAAIQDGVTATDTDALKSLRDAMQSPGATMADLKSRYNANPTAQQQSWDSFLSEMKKQLVVEKYLAKKITIPTPSDGEVQQAYDKNRDKFIMPPTVRLSHVFFDLKNMDDAHKKAVRTKAERALAKLNSGAATFEELVQSDSEDGNSKSRLGDIGYIMDNEQYRQLLGAGFVNSVFAIRAGRTSSILESPEGYHIIKVTEKNDQKLLALADNNPAQPGSTVKQLVQNQLRAMKFQEAALSIIQTLRQRAQISVNEANWGPWIRGEKAAS